MLLLKFEKLKIKFMHRVYLRTLFFSCFLVFSCLSFAKGTVDSAPDIKEPLNAVVEIPEAGSVDLVCQLIYGGRFSDAGEFIEQFTKSPKGRLGQLAGVIEEYKQIDRRREQNRQAAYQEQLTELKKLQFSTDVNDVNDVNDFYDGNDVNDISKAFTVISKAYEFADENQKGNFLSGTFVKQVIEDALGKASEYEAKGKWLDSYLICYTWLQTIYQNNQAYADYAEELLEKANIVASFQDSTCESSEDRYAGVKKKMFIRAVSILNFNYVNDISYREMALKALKRCRFLTEVMKLSYSEIQKSSQPESSKKQRKLFISPPDSKKLASWASGLSKILDGVFYSSSGMSKDKFIDIFEKVLALNKTSLNLPETVLVSQFAEGALSSLDPYTVMIWPRSVQEFEKSMTNTFTGIGVEISKQKGLLTVVSLLLDAPAFNSGLIDAGDVIKAVDGLPTKDMTLHCAVQKITGPEGTNVVLTIQRPDTDKSEDVTITRGKVIIPTIRGWKRTAKGDWLYMIDKNQSIGYIRMEGFSERTPYDFEEVLGRLESEGLRGLVLDLRRNPGGLLNAAAEIVDKFIKDGLIVSTQPKIGFGSYLSAHKKGTHPNYPVVVLIDSLSASASEIVAGALADPKYKKAILVGERTHGKGSVQTITHRAGDGAQLKYTMAYYYLPSGQRVESKDAMKKQGRKDWGVGPDIEVKLRVDEFRKMYEVRRDNDVLVKTGHTDNRNGVELNKHTIQETLESDPQLAVGILVIKTKLIQSAVGG